MIITIDGPSASGKSTIARNLAQELKIYYLHTGLLYRALTYLLLKSVSGSLQKFQEKLSTITATDLQALTATITYHYRNSKALIEHDGKDITSLLCDASLDQPVSILSTSKTVRQHLLGIQREIARDNDLVADGRDCGSVVFPEADHKFFLTADVTIRAQRYIEDEKRQLPGAELEKVKLMLEERDERDYQREVAPLTLPKDATIIDNSTMTTEETIEEFLSAIHKKKTARSQ